MIVKRTIYLVIGMVLLIGSVTAADVSGSTIANSNSGWLMADNGLSTSTITVNVRDSSSNPVSGATVAFSINAASAGMGTISPASVVTGADGTATATFSTGTKSGNATIDATISSGTDTKQVSIFQRVNHYYAQYVNFVYPSSATVGSVVTINLTLTDMWGNRVDNLDTGDVHPVFLDVATSGDDPNSTAGFWDGSGYVTHLSRQTDLFGNVSVVYRLSTTAGTNYFAMEPVGNIPMQILSIQGTGDPTPAYISQTYPSPDSLPADGEPENYFTIYYTVMDQYWNPIAGAPVQLSSPDQTVTKVTSPSGKIMITYGPKDTIGHYTLSAATPGNASVRCVETETTGSCSQSVEYYNTDPVDLTLTANPQGMASLDVDGTSKAIIQAKVVDIKGNPVVGEPVVFSNSTPIYSSADLNITTYYRLSSKTATTGAEYASIEFYPDAFTTSGAGYNGTATGTIVVFANWTDRSGTVISKTVTLVWKNYPYVSVYSSAACTNAKVGDTINVTVQLAGDGTALRPKPIDAILVMDNSGSMGSTPKMTGSLGSQYKIAYAKLAGTTFVNSMDQTTDQVGLTSYNASAKVQYSLSSNFNGTRGRLNNLPASGNTNTRSGLKLAIEDMNAHSTNTKAIKAIILLTDGAYNTYGDPLARRSDKKMTSSWSASDGDMRWWNFSDLSAANQNLAYYAAQNNIRIYTVTLGLDTQIQPSYVNGSSVFQIYDTMDRIAAQTGGTHYHATTGTQLVDIYTDIAGQLKDTAGGNTQASFDFGTVNINNQPASNLTNYMTYIHNISTPLKPLDSTYVNKTNLTSAGAMNLLWEYSRDDTNNWSGSHNIAFVVGTIKLNETWTSSFRLNLTKMGNIELFGPNSSSQISFTDASSGLTTTSFIPAIQCNVLQSRNNTGFGDKQIFINNLSDGGLTTLPDHWPIQWNTTYNGAYFVTEEVKFKNLGKSSSSWQTVPGGVSYLYNTFEQTSYLTIDTSDASRWPAGYQYCVQITGYADDVNGAATTDTLCRTKPSESGTQYIKLQ